MLLAALVVVLVLAVAWAARHPSHDRNWAVEQSIFPRADFDGSRVAIRGVRNFRWTGAAAYTPAWEERSYDLDQLATAWYVLVPFSEKFRGPAHAFVSFGFDDGRYLAISVEARREVGEAYGVVAGMFRRYELIYVVGDEQDLIGRRAVFDDDEVFLYPVRASREAVRTVFVAMLERANQLHQRPEFYNTLTNNCTLNLVRQVNQLSPGLIPTASWRIILPGYSDAVVHRLGLIDSTGSVAEVRARFRVNERAAAALGHPDFSRLIRE